MYQKVSIFCIFFSGLLFNQSAFASTDSLDIINKLIIGEWQAISFETPVIDSYSTYQHQEIIEDIQQWTEIPEELWGIYNGDNLDSAKLIALQYAEDIMADFHVEKEQFVKGLSFTFTAEGYVYLRSFDFQDTLLWHTETDSLGNLLLIIDPFIPGKEILHIGVSIMNYIVENISEDYLHLKLNENEDDLTFLTFERRK